MKKTESVWDHEPEGVRVTDTGNVEERANALGLQAPHGVAILPRHFFDAKDVSGLVYEASTQEVRSLLRQAGVPLGKVEPDGTHIPYRAEHDATWVGPTLFFGASLLSQQPEILSVALGVISNYLTDYFRGLVGKSRVRFGLVIEKTDKKTTVRIDYDGPLEGLPEVGKQVKAALK